MDGLQLVWGVELPLKTSWYPELCSHVQRGQKLWFEAQCWWPERGHKMSALSSWGLPEFSRSSQEWAVLGACGLSFSQVRETLLSAAACGRSEIQFVLCLWSGLCCGQPAPGAWEWPGILDSEAGFLNTLFQPSCFCPLSPRPLCRINNFHVKCLKIWNERGCKVYTPLDTGPRFGAFPLELRKWMRNSQELLLSPTFLETSTVQRGDLMPQSFPPEPRCRLPAAKLDQDWGSVP